ncbi:MULTISPECIES: DNA polymerase III subunit delta' [unclassified Virgibacillus]|uniref:DNA polymerase III subunit delta' n=1 Tax=unclassified Virgibacillus TaxID=2620237 RepID=UPI0024DEE728|nr:DNA polymerase III subunit delta' [Virgibacillus sp. LDC-1]
MKTWEEMEKVQPLASRIITNSIQKDRISHAYLIQGARGTGKREIAQLLAKGLFCEQKTGIEPCNACNMCKRIDSRNHPDVHWIEPEGQSIKIEQVRRLQKEFTYSGLESDQKVYIIQSAELLTLNAANRILKFLEEPNKKTTAIMLTENSQAIIATIRSRCQVIDLQPLSPTLFYEILVESGVSEGNAVFMRALTNDLNEATRLLSDDWFAEARKLVVQLVEMFAINPDDVYLFIHRHWLAHFKDREQHEQGLDLLLLAFRDVLYFHIGNEAAIVCFQAGDERLERLAMHFSQEQLAIILQQLLQAKRSIKQNVHPTLVMEQLTLQIQR